MGKMEKQPRINRRKLVICIENHYHKCYSNSVCNAIDMDGIIST